MRLVVSDTGPVLHLIETRALHLLEQTGEVVVPPAVERELSRRISSWVDIRPAWMRLRQLTDAARQEAHGWLRGDLLDPGEADALALARQLEAD